MNSNGNRHNRNIDGNGCVTAGYEPYKEIKKNWPANRIILKLE